MFFTNLILYQLTEPLPLQAEEFHEKLQSCSYFPCPRSENVSVGWVSPYGLHNDSYVHVLGHYYLFAFCKEEKILPSSVIREELDKKIALLQEREDRMIYRKEKIKLREEVIIELRNRAFSRKKIIYCYLDTRTNWLLINTSSRAKSEEICTFLRKSLSSLKLALPVTKSAPEKMMTAWLLNEENLPNFKVQYNCEMLDPKQKTALIKFKEHDLNSKEIVHHLISGKEVAKITLNWQEKISFEFAQDLSVKKIKFLHLIKNSAEETAKLSPEEQIDNDFALMTGEFSCFFPDLWALFGGLMPLEN